MTKKQKELAIKHGTPDQFEKAIWKAYADLFITQAKAMAAIQKYKDEWKALSDNILHPEPLGKEFQKVLNEVPYEED